MLAYVLIVCDSYHFYEGTVQDRLDEYTCALMSLSGGTICATCPNMEMAKDNDWQGTTRSRAYAVTDLQKEQQSLVLLFLEHHCSKIRVITLISSS